MTRDDGLGPYTFCKRGQSHCDDQTCECVDSAKYRAMYIMARERRGWTIDGDRHEFLQMVVVGITAGAALGLVLAVIIGRTLL